MSRPVLVIASEALFVAGVLLIFTSGERDARGLRWAKTAGVVGVFALLLSVFLGRAA